MYIPELFLIKINIYFKKKLTWWKIKLESNFPSCQLMILIFIVVVIPCGFREISQKLLRTSEKYYF